MMAPRALNSAESALHRTGFTVENSTPLRHFAALVVAHFESNETLRSNASLRVGANELVPLTPSPLAESAANWNKPDFFGLRIPFGPLCGPEPCRALRAWGQLCITVGPRGARNGNHFKAALTLIRGLSNATEFENDLAVGLYAEWFSKGQLPASITPAPVTLSAAVSHLHTRAALAAKRYPAEHHRSYRQLPST